MPGFVREHLRPLMGSAGLHVLLLVLVAGAALRWTSTQPPVQLAIEGVVVDARDLPKSARAGRAVPPPKVTPPPETPRPQPEAKPQPEPAPPQPDVKAAEEARAAERAMEARAAREKAAEAERRRVADEAARKKVAADAERKRVAEAEADARRKKDEQERAARESKLQGERQAELQRQLEAEEEAAAVARSGVVDEYRALLIQAIERNWIRPPSARAGLECTLYVTQATGGTVIDVKLGTCNGDQAVRESIANAVYRASPLPAPRDPRAFERRLQIVFKPTE